VNFESYEQGDEESQTWANQNGSASSSFPEQLANERVSSMTKAVAESLLDLPESLFVLFIDDDLGL
jgi:hypothetical protein